MLSEIDVAEVIQVADFLDGKNFGEEAGFHRPGDFEAIAVAASSPDFSPCVACREVINELGDQTTIVFEFKGETVVSQLNELLPYNFKM